MSSQMKTMAVLAAWVVGLVGLGGGLGGVVQAAPTTNSVLRSVPAPGPVKLDGDLSKWDQSGAIVMADDTDKPRKLVRVTSMYDAGGLYLALEFKDPTPLVNHVNPHTSPDRAWCGDAVQVRINTGPDGVAAPLVPEKLLHLDAYWYTDGKEAAAYVVYGDLGPGGKVVKKIAAAEGKGVDQAFRMDQDGQGYVQQLRIDWKLVRDDGGAYKPGEKLRLAIEAMWGDPRYRDQPAERLTDLLNPKRFEREMLWTNPAAFGTVEFVAKGGLEPSATAALWPKFLERYEQTRKTAATQVAMPEPVATAPKPDRPCLDAKTETQRLLNTWFAEGKAAGNRGDYYDNRDRNHAALDLRQFPQVTLLDYTPEQRRQSQDYGLFLGTRDQVTFGNSSTASQPERGGCNPRHAMAGAGGGLERLQAQYRAGNMYVYPAHHDYHPGHDGQPMWGDLLPFNSPCVLISLGSSGSDIPFLNAFFHTTAAFTPPVKALLLKHGLLVPTVQAIFRRSNTKVVQAEDYFSGQAHPVVFDGTQIDELKMVQAAQALTPETIPPLPLLQVVEEDALTGKVNAPEGTRAEAASAAPSTIGRVFRRWDRTMRLKVSAAGSFDYLKRPLQYRWALLQGDPKLVKIEPSADGREAVLTIGWHDRFPVQPGSDIDTNRVDIGVFATAGQGWSAPAFVSVYCPDNEVRTYDEKDRLVDIFYAGGDTRIGYQTNCLLPVDGGLPYPIRDWPELLTQAAVGGNTLAARLFNAALDEKQRAVVAGTHKELRALLTQVKEAQAGAAPRDIFARRQADELNAEAGSVPLLKPVPELGGSVKDLLERMLNAWVDEPEFYLKHRADMDAALAKLEAPAQARVRQARQRLMDLGIYQVTDQTKWELHSVRPGTAPVAERLTKYERLELQRFHLALLNDLVLPGILVRPYLQNCVDYRLTTARPQWLVFEYPASGPPLVRARITDVPPTTQPLEDP